MNIDITKEELLELAAQKLADMHYNDGDIESVRAIVSKEVEKRIAKSVGETIDSFLKEALEKIVASEIQPLNVWGEPVGEKTTIKDLLHKKALNYWAEKVDSSGKPSTSYNAKPRSVFLVGEVVNEEFKKALSDNVKSVVKALHDSLQAEAHKRTDDLLKSMIKI
jgi:hypothetical protein